MKDAPRRERLGFLLNSFAHQAYNATEQTLVPFGITPRILGILETLIQEGPMNQLALARRRRIDPAVMVGVMDKLEESGLAKRQPDSADRRNRLIVITEAGKKRAEEAGVAVDAIEGKMLSCLCDTERETLHACLYTLLESESG